MYRGFGQITQCTRFEVEKSYSVSKPTYFSTAKPLCTDRNVNILSFVAGYAKQLKNYSKVQKKLAKKEMKSTLMFIT